MHASGLTLCSFHVDRCLDCVLSAKVHVTFTLLMFCVHYQLVPNHVISIWVFFCSFSFGFCLNFDLVR